MSNPMKLRVILKAYKAGDDPNADRDLDEAEQLIKDLMVEVFKHSPHDGSFVSISDFKNEVDSL